MTTLDIDTRWPGTCVRHGRPAVRTVTFAVRSKPRLRSRLRTFLPGDTAADRTADYLQQVKIAKVSGWPLCARCLLRRRGGLGLAAVLSGGGAAAFVTCLVVASLPLGLLGLAAMLASPAPLRWAGMPELTRTELGPDGTSIQVTGASLEFVSELSTPPA